MIEYKIKKKTKDIKDSLIQKTGDVVEFTIRDIENDMAYLEKNEKELTAKMGIESAKMENIRNTNPIVDEISERDRVALYLFHESYAFCKVGRDKIKEIKKQKAEYEKELKEIEKQING